MVWNKRKKPIDQDSHIVQYCVQAIVPRGTEVSPRIGNERIAAFNHNSKIFIHTNQVQNMIIVKIAQWKEKSLIK